MDKLTNEEIGVIINILSQVRVTIAESDMLKNIIMKLRNIAIENNQPMTTQSNNG